jgi:hypothetical protein
LVKFFWDFIDNKKVGVVKIIRYKIKVELGMIIKKLFAPQKKKINDFF